MILTHLLLAPSDTASEVSLQTQESTASKRPKTPREVSGQEALLAHIKESSAETEHVPSDIPVLLGESAMLSEKRSIAQIMHSDTELTTSSKSSIQLEIDDEEISPERSDATIPPTFGDDQTPSQGNGE